MKLIIAGSRDFTADEYVFAVMRPIFREHSIEEIICSSDRGIDVLAKLWADEHNIPVREFPIERDKYGRPALRVRNEQMVAYGTDMLLFWDGKTPGIQHLLNISLKAGLPVRIHNFIRQCEVNARTTCL